MKVLWWTSVWWTASRNRAVSWLTLLWKENRWALCSSLRTFLHYSLKSISEIQSALFSVQMVPYIITDVNPTNPKQILLPAGLGARQWCRSPGRTFFLANATEGLVFWPIPHGPWPSSWPVPPSHRAISTITTHPFFKALFLPGAAWSLECLLWLLAVWVGL